MSPYDSESGRWSAPGHRISDAQNASDTIGSAPPPFEAEPPMRVGSQFPVQARLPNTIRQGPEYECYKSIVQLSRKQKFWMMTKKQGFIGEDRKLKMGGDEDEAKDVLKRQESIDMIHVHIGKRWEYGDGRLKNMLQLEAKVPTIVAESASDLRHSFSNSFMAIPPPVPAASEPPFGTYHHHDVAASLVPESPYFHTIVKSVQTNSLACLNEASFLPYNISAGHSTANSSSINHATRLHGYSSNSYAGQHYSRNIYQDDRATSSSVNDSTTMKGQPTPVPRFAGQHGYLTSISQVVSAYLEGGYRSFQDSTCLNEANFGLPLDDEEYGVSGFSEFGICSNEMLQPSLPELHENSYHAPISTYISQEVYVPLGSTQGSFMNQAWHAPNPVHSIPRANPTHRHTSDELRGVADAQRDFFFFFLVQ
ncbi:hypothetical protein BKA67DRAFT_646115 [Truncatella angustata]|uniref:Uncharacterized protein n=1 Tax=Truncatella angustata TaxID=152316 RepID=A0A9P8ULI5_9PEZI|nr:uncharacterized protein BKA67DRAFT_646115 [Truncatella angustata]KAH6654386.1 hypothetical protein BKA67DRAFT_646115 [Truncatella angustata]